MTGGRQVVVSFTTTDPNYRLPDGTPPITVPADATRYGLSQIVNHLLSLDKVVPFEFLVNNEVICTSLGSHISSRSISAENVLEVEYFPAVLPPAPKDDFVHDDWISCASVIRSSIASRDPSSSPAPSTSPETSSAPWILASGCYAGVVKFWNSAGEIDRQYVAHECPIKSCTAINEAQLITTADDGSVHVWDVQEGSMGEGTRLVARLSGHASCVESSCARPDGERCATSGWDKEILVWKSGRSLASEAADGAQGGINGEPKTKRKKRGKSEPPWEEKIAGAPAIASIGTLSGHTQAVSGLKWVTQEQLVSCSWDHTVKLWDVEMETPLDSFNHNKVIYCLDTPNTPTHAGVIAFGGAEKGVRLWDRREHHKQGTFTQALQTFQSHAGWVSDVKWHPTAEHTLLSASFDGSIKLWDVRSAIPLWTVDVAGEEDKLFCCTWIDGTAIACGGTDKTLRTLAIT